MYDSMRITPTNSPKKYEPVSTVMQLQLEQLYEWLFNDDEQLQVTFPPVQGQNRGIDCGIFAIANACELCLNPNIDFTTIEYNQKLMRQHLIDCLLKEKLVPFPKLKKLTRRIKSLTWCFTKGE